MTVESLWVLFSRPRVSQNHTVTAKGLLSADFQRTEMTESQRPATVTFLGTGTSVGVPALGCRCAVCQSSDPRNNRTRCAIAIQFAAADDSSEGKDSDSPTLLIDTPPDLRSQLLRERIGLVNAVLFTHEHADHLFGLDDLRLFPFRLGGPVPLYCESTVEERIRKSFDYAFTDRQPTHPGATPQLECRPIDRDTPFEVLGVTVTPIPLKHGPHFDVLGFRIGDFAYCTDTNEIPPSSIDRLQGVKTFVVGALRYRSHPTHFNVDEAIEVAAKVGASRTLLTHISHDLDHGPANEMLPPGIELAYDGLKVELTF